MNAVQNAKPWLALALVATVLGCDDSAVEPDDLAQLAMDDAALELDLEAAESSDDPSPYIVTLDLETDFELTREEAVAVRMVDGFRFDIGMRIEDHAFLTEDGETSVELDLAAPDFSEVSFGGELQQVQGSPVVALSVGDSSFCGEALVRSYHVDQQPVGLIVDMSHIEPMATSDFSATTQHHAASSTDATPAGDVLYSTFNKCDRFVGSDGKCGGTCGKYRFWIQEVWGEYSYGNCVPAGSYWLSSCKCTGPYGAWEH